MTVTLSVVLILGIALAVLLRFKSLGAGACVVAVLFGFYLAGTDASDPISKLTAAVVDALRAIDT